MQIKVNTLIIRLLLMIFVCTLFSLPGEIGSKQISLLHSTLPFSIDPLVLRNWCHAGVFLLLTTILIAIKIKPHNILLLIVSLAIMSELIQYWVPKRSSRVDDVLFDIAGGSVPLIILMVLAGLRKCRSHLKKRC
jgi:hypothetical protein